MLLVIAAAVALVISLAMPCRVATAAAVDGAEFFESRIRPVLVEHCHECHAGDAAEGGLRLDSLAGFDAGGKSGRLIDEKQPSASLLLRLIRHEIKDREMPQGADKLPDAVIADFQKWIENRLPGLAATPPLDVARCFAAGGDRWFTDVVTALAKAGRTDAIAMHVFTLRQAKAPDGCGRDAWERLLAAVPGDLRQQALAQLVAP